MGSASSIHPIDVSFEKEILDISSKHVFEKKKIICEMNCKNYNKIKDINQFNKNIHTIKPYSNTK
jgi:hypothetical protein